VWRRRRRGRQVVSAFADGSRWAHDWVLSEEQVRVLDAWLKEAPSRLKPNFGYAAKTSLSLEIKAGGRTVRNLEFFDQPGWSNSVVIKRRIASFSPTQLASLTPNTRRAP